MSVKIIADSSADLLPALKARVEIVPLRVCFGAQEYGDGVEILPEEFYERLASSQTLPTTSQPTPAVFEDAFRAAVDQGHEVVCVTISSRLSGTYQSATIAAREFPGKVFVVDSRSVAVGMGALVTYALDLAEQGKPGEEILNILMAARKRLRIYAMVDTLEYLKKGGRLNAATALVGGLLNIKPVVGLEDGELKVFGTARGLKKAFALLDDCCGDHGGADPALPMLLGYTGTSPEQLEKYRENTALPWARGAGSTIVGAAIGVHAGPGAVTAALFTRE